MDAHRSRFLWLTLLFASDCAANHSRDVAPVIVVDVPPAPSAQRAVAAAPVVPTDAGLATAEGEGPTVEEGLTLSGDGGAAPLGFGFLVLKAPHKDAGAPIGGRGREGEPRVRGGAVTVSGRLPLDVVERIVRKESARFRSCYMGGLRDDPALAGTVVSRFELNDTGTVGVVADGGSTISDLRVRDCVHRAFQGLSFPRPEGGTVKVVYPVIFSLEPNR